MKLLSLIFIIDSVIFALGQEGCKPLDGGRIYVYHISANESCKSYCVSDKSKASMDCLDCCPQLYQNVPTEYGSVAPTPLSYGYSAETVFVLVGVVIFLVVMLILALIFRPQIRVCGTNSCLDLEQGQQPGPEQAEQNSSSESDLRRRGDDSGRDTSESFNSEATELNMIQQPPIEETRQNSRLVASRHKLDTASC